MNYQNHFYKAGILSDTLQQALQIMTGIHTVFSKTGQPLQEVEDAAIAMDIIKS